MAETDGPLKRLVSMFSNDFAAWLLHAMARLAVTYRLALLSVVIYVGRGVGEQDTGNYQIQSPTGIVSLAWQYEVIRLWQMPAETLLTLNRPALLPLVGQTQIAQPEVVLPRVVSRLQEEPEGEHRQQFVIGFLALLAEEEWLHMVKQLLAEDWLIDGSPYLQGVLEEGRQEGSLFTRQRDILTVLAARFELSEAARQQVEQQIATHTDETSLAALLVMAAQSTDLAAFLVALMRPEQR